MSQQHQINVKNDGFSPKNTDVTKGSGDTVIFVQSGNNAPTTITVSPSGLFNPDVTTCSVGTNANNAPVYTLASGASGTYTLNVPAGVEQAKDPGTIIVTG